MSGSSIVDDDEDVDFKVEPEEVDRKVLPDTFDRVLHLGDDEKIDFKVEAESSLGQSSLGLGERETERKVDLGLDPIVEKKDGPVDDLSHPTIIHQLPAPSALTPPVHLACSKEEVGKAASSLSSLGECKEPEPERKVYSETHDDKGIDTDTLDDDSLMWVEKYRPVNLSDLVSHHDIIAGSSLPPSSSSIRCTFLRQGGGWML